jgi:hypothetical protein
LCGVQKVSVIYLPLKGSESLTWKLYTKYEDGMPGLSSQQTQVASKVLQFNILILRSSMKGNAYSTKRSQCALRYKSILSEILATL